MINLKKKDIQIINEMFPIDLLFANNLNWFALIDPGIDQKVNKLTCKKKEVSLFENLDDKEYELSPKIVQLSHDYSDWDIFNNDFDKAAVSIILTHLNLKEVSIFLKNLTMPIFESGIDSFFAFWDPVVLSALVGNEYDRTNYYHGCIFNDEQKNLFLNPFVTWCYWDRINQLQFILEESKSVDITEKLIISEKQEELILLATLPDTIIYYLNLNNKFLLESFESKIEIYDFVCECILLFEKLMIDNLRDKIDLTCYIIIMKFKENNDEELITQLKKISLGEKSVSDLFA